MLPAIRITRRTIDPITLTELVDLECIPRLEDSVLDEEVTVPMSYRRKEQDERPIALEEVGSVEQKLRSKEGYDSTYDLFYSSEESIEQLSVSTSSVEEDQDEKSLILEDIGTIEKKVRSTDGHDSNDDLFYSSEKLEEQVLVSASFAEKEEAEKLLILEDIRPIEKRLRFTDGREELEIPRLDASLYDDLFYSSEELANFRYEAFLEEAGFDKDDYM
jgi:hypothetical protein